MYHYFTVPSSDDFYTPYKTMATQKLTKFKWLRGIFLSSFLLSSLAHTDPTNIWPSSPTPGTKVQL